MRRRGPRKQWCWEGMSTVWGSEGCGANSKRPVWGLQGKALTRKIWTETSPWQEPGVVREVLKNRMRQINGDFMMGMDILGRGATALFHVTGKHCDLRALRFIHSFIHSGMFTVLFMRGAVLGAGIQEWTQQSPCPLEPFSTGEEIIHKINS